MIGQDAARDAEFRELLSLYANDIVLLFDDQFRLLDCNERAPEAYGYARDELLALTLADLRADEQPVSIEDRKASVRQRGDMVFESIHKRRDGSTFFVETSIRVVETESGSYYHTTVRDITERKRVEEELRESERRYREFFATSRDSVLITSTGGELIDFNDAALEMFGYDSREELLEVPISSLYVNPEERSEVLALIERQGYLKEHPVQFRRRDGAAFDALVTSGSGFRRNADGSESEYYGTIRDISERKQTEDALRESEEQFRQFAEYLPGRMTIKDAELRYVYGNDEKAAEPSLPSARWIGRTPEELWTPQEARTVRDIGERVLAGEVVEGVSESSSDYGIAYQRSVHFPILREDGSVLVGGISIDVTEQVEAQEEVLRQAEQLRRTVEGAVLAMSHVVETRDPYTAGHERRVSELATAIAAEMGMEGEELTALRLAGLIHDVGKVAVPAEILSKPGRLSTVEFDLIKQHAQIGFEILAAIDFGLPVAEMVLQHHERLDGSGYPRQLKGADILPEARILAVADVVEAMSSHRPYRPALGMKAALTEVRAHAGIKFDADVVTVCAGLIEEQDFKFTP